MNGRELQAALDQLTNEPVGWTADTEGHIYVGREDNIDALIVVGPFPPDPTADAGTVHVGFNGAEEQVEADEINAVLQLVADLLATRPR